MNRSRWLTAGAAMVATAAIARAQVSLPPEVNLFGDDPGQQIRPFPAPSEAANQPTPAPDSQTLTFQDQRQIHGELVEVTKDEIVWRRQDASASMRFPRSEVRSVILAPIQPEVRSAFPRRDPAMKHSRKPSKPDAPVPATVKLAGGDWLFGNVASPDGQSFTLKLEDGTPVAIPRDQIEWLYFDTESVPAFGFSGTALDLEGWAPPAAALEVANGTVTVNGANWIGHAVSPPTRFEIAFTLPEGSEEGTRLWLQPFGPRPNIYGQGTVELRFGPKVFSHMFFVDQFDRQTSPVPEEAAAEKGPASYRIFYDEDARRLVVRRNERELGDWKLGPADNGQHNVNAMGRLINGICFDREGHGLGELKLQNIRFRPWNGRLPDEGDAAQGPDRLSIEDTPAIDGKLESIAAESLMFSGAAVSRNPDVDVQFSHAPMVLPGADSKLQFGKQGEFTARLLQVREGKVLCETAFNRTLEVPAAALHVILFEKRAPPTAEPADVLVFKNGDELQGHVLSASANSPLRWKSPAGQELEFQPGHIAGIRLALDPEAREPTAASTIELRNGDRLRGRIVALDEKQLHLQQEPLGSMTVERNAVWHLYPNPKIEVLDGGLAPNEWTRTAPPSESDAAREAAGNAPPWVHLDGTYIQRGDWVSLFNVEMPGLQHEISSSLERFEIRFEAAASVARATYFGLRLSAKDHGPSLSATVVASALYLFVQNPQSRNRANRRNIPLKEKLPPSKPSRAVRLFVDTRAGTCDIFINGVALAHLGKDPNERLGKSDYTFRLQPYSSGGIPNVLSNLWIGPWSGELPQPAAATLPSTALVNGDVAPGAPKEMHDGKWSLDGELGGLDFPVEKVLAVDFGGEMHPEHTAARLRLVDGTTMNVDGFQWKGRELTAHSAILGDIRLPLGAVAELVYDPPLPHAPMTPEPAKLVQKTPATPDPKPEAER